MFSRRVGSRFNRRSTISVSGIPLAALWTTGGYWDADNGPVDVGAGAISTWVPLVGSTNFVQATSADRGTLDTTTMSGGRKSIYFDGSTDYMSGDALSTALSGDDTPRVLALHVKTPSSIPTLAAMSGPGHSSQSDRHPLQMQTDHWRILRGAAATASQTTSASTCVAATEYTIIESFSGTTTTLWVNGVKLIDDQGLDAVALTFDNFTIGGHIVSGTLGACEISIRRVALAPATTLTDGQAATIHYAWSGS